MNITGYKQKLESIQYILKKELKRNPKGSPKSNKLETIKVTCSKKIIELKAILYKKRKSKLRKTFRSRDRKGRRRMFAKIKKPGQIAKNRKNG